MKNHQVNDMGQAVAIGSASLGLGIVLALAISIAFHPPKNRLETIGLAASGIAGTVFLGAFVVEYFGLQYMSVESQIWIRICCGVPCWFGWQIIAVQLNKWRNAKNPIGQIRKDLKK
jgi:hypothetical protein